MARPISLYAVLGHVPGRMRTRTVGRISFCCPTRVGAHTRQLFVVFGEKFNEARILITAIIYVRVCHPRNTGHRRFLLVVSTFRACSVGRESARQRPGECVSSSRRSIRAEISGFHGARRARSERVAHLLFIDQLG